MKKMKRLGALSPGKLALLLALACHSSTTAEVVFSESFESPVVSGFASNTVPDNGNWIGSRGPFNATLRGLYNESVIYPATPTFDTPYGEQGYSLNYSTTMLTTAQGATGQTITADVAYTLTFNAAFEEGTTANYLAHLVAFDATDDNAAREDSNNMAGTIVAQATGEITASDMSDQVTIVFSPDASHPQLGKELAIRFDKTSGNAIYDNVRLIVGHDYTPNPASGEDLAVGGNVTLSWTNLPTEAPATETYVDILFGTDSENLGLILDGQLGSSVVASAPQAGTYYWQIISYPDGNPAGTPVSSNVFSFTIADTDGDGIPDDWEIQYFGSGTGADANADPDNDGLTNLQEYNLGTDPTNPDTDGDGLLDGVETATGIWVSASDTGTHPLVADTDGDGLLDGVETNTGVWVGPHDTGTNPLDPDTDSDGLLDSWETNTGVFVSRFDTGTDPHNKDTDGDGVWDYYEVAAAFTDPNDANDTPNVTYPLPAPDPSDTGVTNKPVKVYIMSGQSNMLGFGKVSGPEDFTLDNITGKFNRFPNLVGPDGDYLARPDVKYRGVYSGIANMALAPGGGKDSNSIGPELAFGHVMGWYHDEPVLLLKSSIGNRSLGWDILPPGSPSYEYTKTVNDEEVTFTYAAYGERSQTYPVGESSAPWTPGDWYAGKEFDNYFMDESEWAHPEGDVINVVDVLDNFAAQYPEWAEQGFEIAGFVWWQGDKDRYEMGHATKYEENLVNLIDTLRNYYSTRYPGQVVPNAPFVLATLGQTAQGDTSPASDVAILEAQMAVDGEAGNYPLYAGNVKTVYAHPLSQGGASNSHYGLNSETYLLVGDALGSAMVQLQETETPPFPNPSSFEIAPSGISTTEVSMVATEATSANGPVEYYFENVTTGDFRDWSTDRTWTNTGLTGGETYSYRVKTRDSNLLEGEWSAAVDGTAETDTTAPSPDPMSFDALPTTLGEDSITMTATTALDINGVEYYFANTAGGGPDSGWQVSPTYTPTGLAHSTEYSYTVKARDNVGNETAASAPASATTDSPDLAAPTPDPMTFATAPTAQGENSVTMTATIASDASGVEYYFACTAGPGNDSGWQDSPEYTDTGLAAATEYTYVVRARDKSPAQNLTGDSAPASATTEAPDLTAPSVSQFTPSDDASDVPIGTDLIITFDEDIEVGTGLITIKNLTDSAEVTIDITDASQVSVSGSVLTITPASSLLNSKGYAVQIAATAVTDLVGNAYTGISDDTTWNFSTEAPPPEGVVFSDDFEAGDNPWGGTTPDVNAAGSDGNTSGQANTSLWVRATQGFGAGRNGLVDESGGDFTDPVGEQAYAFRYTNSGLTTAEGIIGSLIADTTYTVTFDVVIDGHNAGANYKVGLVTFNGAARNDVRNNTGATSSLAEVNGSVSSSYEKVTLEYTSDGTESSLGHDVAIRVFGSTSHAIIDNVEVVTSSGPDTTAPAVATLSPSDGATDVAIDSNLIVTFDEDIAAGTGLITLKNLTDATESSFDVTGGEVSISGTTLTINPASDLLNGKDYAVQIADTAVLDLAGNAFAGITDETTWNFSTASAVSNDFTSWISGYDVGGLTGPDDDADGDGVSNVVENYFGTDPGSYSAGLSAKQVNSGAGTSFEFSHPINDSPAADITASYKWTADLGAAFLEDGATDGNGTTVNFSVGTPANGEVTVTASISGTEPGQIFVVVDVTQNP